MALGTAEPVAITARGGNTTIVQIKGEKNQHKQFSDSIHVSRVLN